MHALYEEHRDAVAFFLVYIREAHADDAWQISSNVRDGVVHDSPADLGGRTELARTCSAELQIPFPTLVDDFDDAVDEAYTGWPERLYLIGADGRVAYKGGPGPFGFDPEALRAALDALPE